MSNFLELVEKRQSCRSYDGRPVELEKLTQMLEAARLAPSACNSQSWFFTVVTQPQMLEAVRKSVMIAGMNQFAADCPAFIICEETGANLTSKIGGILKDQQYTQIDMGLAVMQMVLAGVEQGLSSCTLGWFNDVELQNVLPLKGGRIRLVVCVGYAADEEIRPKKRKPMEQISQFI